MSVRVRIPSPLRNYTNGADVVETQGASVGEVLNSLKTKAGGIETRLFKGPTSSTGSSMSTSMTRTSGS